MTVRVTLKGDENLQKDIERIRQKIQDGSVMGLIGRAALSVEREAKMNASGRPGPMVRTGRLRSSISTMMESYEKAFVGTNVYYAPFVEFGHRIMPRYRRAGNALSIEEAYSRLSYKMAPAYPFMGPTLQQVDLEGICATFGRELEGEWT